MTALLRQPGASERSFGFLEGSKPSDLPVPKRQGPARRRFGFGAAAPSAVSDSTHQHDDRADAEFVLDGGVKSLPRVLEVIDVSADSGMAPVDALLLSEREEGLPFNFRVSQFNQPRPILAPDGVEQFTGHADVLLGHRPRSIAQCLPSHLSTDKPEGLALPVIEVAA